MATQDWPRLPAFQPAEMTWGARVPKSRFTGFFTNNSQTVSHLADRLAVSLRLRPCSPLEAADREAFFTGLASTGDFVRLWHMQRPVPQGSLRGLPTAAAAAAAGARQLQVQTTPAATLLSGDLLGAPGQLLPVAYGGAVADAAGVMQLPLQMPLRLPVAINAPLAWQQPTGSFELVQTSVDFTYGRGAWQQGFSVSFAERF